MKFAVYSLGCKVNAYEIEYVRNELIKKGFNEVSFDDEADIYVINTCTVTNNSDKKSRQIINKASSNNKDAMIVVMGCYSQIKGESLIDIPNVKVVLGSNNKGQIANYIDRYLANKETIIDIPSLTKACFDDMAVVNFTSHTRAFLKIEDGCENYCTYCIIPYTRGPVRSKPFNEVIEEVKKLVSNNFKEIVLVGIHTGHYGSDINSNLTKLLLEIEKIPGDFQIRLSSVEITELDEAFLEYLKISTKLAPHLHIPLQSGNDKILKLMNRKYDLKYYANKIFQIRNIVPDIAITTDVIVGFPSETEEDFNMTCEFIKKTKLAGGHVFSYSKRDKTIAAKMDNQISGDIKKERSNKLNIIFDELKNIYYQNMINKESIFIAESYIDGYLIGYNSYYMKTKVLGSKEMLKKASLVKIKSITKDAAIGEFV